MSHSAKQNSINDLIYRRSVEDWLSRPFTWRIPVYQRHYAWDAGNEAGPVHMFWETVEEHTVARLKGETQPPHYLGAVLVNEKTQQDPLGETKNFDVVDGQQRLTTIQLALLALINVAEKHSAGVKEDLEKYIFSEIEKPKLWPTNFDNKQYRTVLFSVYGELMGHRVAMSDENAEKSKVLVNFEFFEERFQNLISLHEDAFGVNKVIQKLQDTLLHGFDLVLIALRETDEAQKVFESLNNYSKPLTTFDLIRNHVFYRAAKEGKDKDVELFNSRIWQQFEEPYWDGAAGQRAKGDENTHIEAYIARMLVAKMRDGNIKFNRNDIFKAYKKFSDNYEKVVDEVKSAADYIHIYKYLAAITEKNPVADGFRFGLFRWTNWSNKDFYPLIFVILKSGVEIAEQQKMIKLLESYVVRRGVCGLSSGHYNKDVASMCKKIGDHPSHAMLRKMLESSKNDTSRFPDDDEVLLKSISTNFYRKSPAYVMKRVAENAEGHAVEEIMIRDKLSIDHILPQGWKKNDDWKKILLGSSEHFSKDDVDAMSQEVDQEVDRYINTIGNLTLLSKEGNARKSNKSWQETKELLRHSGLLMNRNLSHKEIWGIEDIKKRSRRLAEVICDDLWPRDK